MRADNHLFGAHLQILNDLLQDEHLSTDELLLEVALELALTELMALFE